MSRRYFALLLILTALAVHPLVANASHDVPRRAAGIKLGLVRAHQACTVPNAVHDQVVVFNAACAPAAPLSTYSFGPQGQGKALVQTVAGGVELRFALTNVHTAADAPADGVMFAGRVFLRLTDDGCSSAAACTVETSISVDIPCVRGRCFTNSIFPNLILPVGLNGSAEVLGVDVLDDFGDRFATQGLLLN